LRRKDCGRTEKDEHRTSNIEHRTSNIEHRTSNDECENIKKQSLKPELLNDILEETEELIKIFVTNIKTAEKKKK
jgi:hypothetical protein